MSKQFTWWRRFHSTPKLQKKHLYKGVSELLQRIEFGEFEFDKLGREVYLEDKIYEYQKNKIIKEKPWLNADTLPEAIEHIKKQWKKRTHIMWDIHLKNERKRINTLLNRLAKEFNFSVDFVQQIVDEFDGTVRDLYYKCLSEKKGKNINPKEIPRVFLASPVHFLKKDQHKWKQLWLELIKENEWNIYLESHPV